MTAGGERRRGPLELATEETFRAGARGGARRERRGDYDQELLAFQVGDERYAVPILRVLEILKLRPITEVPRAPSFVRGVISLRGGILPVLDLRARLRLAATTVAAPKEARILVVTKADERFGLVVDRVRTVVRLRDEQIEPPPPTFRDVEAEFLAGIARPRGEPLLVLLDLDPVLAFTAGRRGGPR